MGKVSESIFSGKTAIIPMADVQHIERHWYPSDKDRTKDNCRGFIVVTKHTTWDKDMDFWANNIYLAPAEGKDFLKAWCFYRHELDSISTIGD